MKILNISNIYFTLPYFLGDQLKHLTNRGYEIHLICSPSEQLSEFAKKHNCEYAEVEIIRKFSIIADFKALFALYKYIKINKFDIVSGHTPKAGMLAMLAARLAGVKKRIYFRHGLVYETATGIKRQILLWSERLASWCSTKTVCVSPYLIERSLKDNLSSPEKLIILNRGSCTGIDAINYFNPKLYKEIDKKNLRASFNIPENAFVIGFVGRMVRDKGIIELVEAYNKLKELYPQVYLLLVGPLEERDAIPNVLVDYIHHEKNIVCTGLVENNMPLFYSIMDVFILPTHREGLGVSLLEAESMGIPVLTTSHSGARDAIDPGVSGEYIEMNPDSIFINIKKYINNPELCKQQGEAGRRFILENFRQELIWDEIEKLYNE